MPACHLPCPACERHVRSTERACPFCAAALPADFAAGACTRGGSATRVASRAALLFVGAAAIAGCGGETATEGTKDAAVEDARPDQGQPVALYGPAPVRDAGDEDASDASSAPDVREGGTIALYGPPPLRDAGGG